MADIAIVSTWNTPCGIAEYAAYWVEAVKAADPTLKIEVVSDLHPNAIFNRPTLPDVIFLNFQAALLSQWHAEHIKEAQRRGARVLTTYHDSGVPNSDQCKAICGASDYFVIHEPFDDLPAHGEFMRQGIPAGAWSGVHRRPYPVVGTVGFPSGYKNFDLLCEASALAGWGCHLLAPNATDEQCERWGVLNSNVEIQRGFTPRADVVSILSTCDATAFLYVCNANGTSGAIRQGIAARRPVVAIRGRQFRDLEDEQAIHWIVDGSPSSVARTLTQLPSVLFDHGIVLLAEMDSWSNKGRRYAEIIRRLLA